MCGSVETGTEEVTGTTTGTAEVVLVFVLEGMTGCWSGFDNVEDGTEVGMEDVVADTAD